MTSPSEPSRNSGPAVTIRGTLSSLGLMTRYYRAALGLWSERLAPRLVLPLGLCALFIAASWAGLFGFFGPVGRMAVSLGALAALAISLWPLTKLRAPGDDEISRRLDLSRPDAHRPLATLADSLAPNRDPVADAIWQQHRARAVDAARRLSALPGDAKLRLADPYALRLFALLALIASAFVAGDERVARLNLAFDWSTPKIPPVPPRLDAWIDPPAYTGRPPIFLTGAVTLQPGEVVRAPLGATLTVRSTSIVSNGEAKPVALLLEHGNGLTPPETKPDGDKPRAAPVEKPGVVTLHRVIRADSDVKVLRDGREVAAFRFDVIPDMPPSVTLGEIRVETASSEKQSPAGIRVGYDLKDDYGIAKAELVIERQKPTDKRGMRTLLPPPAATLTLRLGAGEAALATEDHPWAGETVNIHIRVEDDLGQSATSEVKTVTLPRRPFTLPLAKALVEQRRNLVFAPDHRQDVVLAFDALLFEPERFTPNIGEFLALDGLRAGVRNARTDDRLIEMVDRIYDYARHLENGDMSDAERRLREAEARLRDAIEREAPANEIRKLAEDLRRAMDEFIRELAERALRDRDQNAQERSPNSPERMLSQRDLQDMLRKIEEMARSGNMAEAQRMLNELRQLLEQLRTARRQNVDPRMQELGKQIEELDKLQREQRDLRDRTFRKNQQRGSQQQQGQRQPGQRGQRGQQGQPQPGEGDEEGESDQSLEQQQQALRDRLNQLRERLKQRGMQEGEGFEEAEDGMGDAKGQLGKGQPGQATQGQQKALDGMGKAAQGMAQQLQQQMGEGEGEGEGLGQPGQSQPGRADNRSDPLGRPPPNARRDLEDNSRVQVPDGDQLQGLGERADKVLRELRKRLGEFERPREELDYLERLLRQR